MRTIQLTAGVAVVLCASAFGAGEGQLPREATLEEQVEWLVEEIGTSEDGLTVRKSIELTDQGVREVVEAVSAELQALEDSIAATDSVVFGLLTAVLVVLIAYVVRVRILLAKLQGWREAVRDGSCKTEPGD